MSEWKRGVIALSVIVVLLVGSALAAEVLVDAPKKAPAAAGGPKVTVSTVDDLRGLAATDLTQLDEGDVDVDASALTSDINRRLGVVGARVRSLRQDFTVPPVRNRAGTASTGGGAVRKQAPERDEAGRAQPPAPR